MKAVLFSHSNLKKDPRVLRQIRWLNELGYNVLTIGFGGQPDLVSRHCEIPTQGLFGRYFGYLIRHHQTRFRYFFGRHLSRLPVSELLEADLVIVNEVEYLASNLFQGPISKIPTYLDLHEDHVNHADRGPLEAVAFRKYWKWQLAQTLSFVETRKATLRISCVEQVIAESYAKLFDRQVDLIFNAPDSNNLLPQPTSTGQIKLIHHGMGTKGRGIEATIRALKYLPSEFSLDLVLFATPQFRLKIELLSRFLGVRQRIKIEPGVPLAELPSRLNKADVSVILLSDVTPGHANALPNKFFESIHAKLAVITGPNPSMGSLVQKYNIGQTLTDWKPRTLANCLMALNHDQIALYKENAVVASQKLSSSQSREMFRSIISQLHPEG